MTGNNLKQLVPKLRFPEFREAGAWECKPLGDLVKIVSGGTPKTANLDFWNGGIQWFTPSEIKAKYLSKSERTISRLGLDQSSASLLPAGTLLLSTRATVGEVGIATEPCATNQGFQNLVVDQSENNEFIYYWILSNKGEFVRRASGSTFKEVGKFSVTSIPMFRPKLAEQQRIADCLGSLDDLIDAEERKVEALRAHKRGLMQQMFPQSGEVVPRLRFPEFREAGAWECKPLGDLVKIVSGGTPKTANLDFWNGGIQWFTPSEIKAKYLSKSERTISRLGLDQSSASLLPAGTLLLSTRATVGEVGIATEPCATNQGFQNLVVDQSENNEFIYYWILSNKGEFVRRASGSTFKEVGKFSVTSIPMFRPKLAEQQRIADCLGSLDDLIDAEERKVEALRAHKRGLMQQMFPSPEGG